MNNDPLSHGLWEASAPPAPATAPLAGHVVADVAIVGGGFTGLSAALHCAAAGASVAVVEAVDIGFGGSGRNVGLVNAGMWVRPSVVRDTLGERWGAQLLQQLGDAPALVFDLVSKYGMDCQAVRKGTLHCAVGPAGLNEIAERARQWQQLGAPVRLLDRAEAARATGCSAYAGALLDLRAGTIQPLAYARELARAAVASGAKIFTGTRVTQSEDLGSHWLLHTSTGGTLEAKWVLVATETYTRPDGAFSSIGTELVRLPYFNLATTPLAPDLAARILPERQGAWDTRQVLSSFRLDRENRLVFGSVGALRGTGHAVHRAWAQRALARLFPELRTVAFEHAWYGWIGMTSDALPRLHKLGRNTVGFAGYNGRGIAPGTSFGRDLARLALGEIGEADMPLPASDVAPAPLRRVKESLYEAGSVLTHWTAARV